MNEQVYTSECSIPIVNDFIDKFLKGGRRSCNFICYDDNRFILMGNCMCQKHKDYYILNSTSYNNLYNIALIYLITVLQDMDKKYYFFKEHIPEGTSDLIEYIIKKE